jgi:nucleoside-diphosphate-sugar epimerase
LNLELKHIIITGANGYLGTYICRELLSQGWHVLGLSWDHRASSIIDHPGIEYIRCDITKEIMPQLQDAIPGKKVHAIINAAALLGSSDYDMNYAVNAEGVKNMMDFAVKMDVKRFIQISSVVVIKEFKGPYGETKLICQQMLENSKLDHTVFIPAMILGPEALGINRILKNVLRFPFVVPLIGNGAQTQHPVFVKDLAKYIVLCIDDPKAYRKVYPIAGDTVISFRDLIRLILKLKGKKKFFVPVPAWFAKMLGRIFQKVQKVPLFTAEHVKGVLQDSNLDTSMLKEDLDFQPTPLEEALKFCLDEIGEDWDDYLREREERAINV